MKSTPSILALVLPNLDGRTDQLFFKNALHLGSRLHANAHILAPAGEINLLQQQASKMETRTLCNECAVVLHPLSDSILDQLLKAVDEYDCEFILMENRDEQGESENSTLMPLVLEKAPCPVFLFPPAVDFEVQPIQSFLVPLSGEERASEALKFALSISERLEIPVDLIHVTTDDRSQSVVQALESVGDEFQHEYPALMERIVSEVSPYSSAHQRSFLRKFHHSSGAALEEIIKCLKSSPGGVIIIEWKGTLLKGHAELVKNLIHEQKFLLFLVKVKRQVKSTLKAGPDFQAAS
jgi:hypothetical protein